MEPHKVCVFGLGQVGLPTALYMAQLGLDVTGYDIEFDKAKAANQAGITALDSWDRSGDYDVYVVCTTTGWNGNQPDFSSLYEVAKRINEIPDHEQLISVESTVLPGTCRRIFAEMRGTRRLVHVPHRYWAGDPTSHGVNQTRVIGAIDEESLGLGLDFYVDNLNISLHTVPAIELAEMSKIAENAYRFTQIAFAEELRLISESSGLDFETLRQACNTKWNIEILEARDGVGGGCLPKDIRYLSHHSGGWDKISSAAISADDAYQEWIKSKEAPTVRRRT